MTDVGTLPGGTNSVANAVNDHAQVVGVSSSAPGQSRGFIWENGEMTAIEPLPGDTGSEAVAINRRAQVLAFSYSSSGGALLLWQDGATIDLTIGANPQPDAMRHALNNRGEVVGQHLTASGAIHAALWTTRRLRDER